MFIYLETLSKSDCLIIIIIRLFEACLSTNYKFSSMKMLKGSSCWRRIVKLLIWSFTIVRAIYTISTTIHSVRKAIIMVVNNIVTFNLHNIIHFSPENVIQYIRRLVLSNKTTRVGSIYRFLFLILPQRENVILIPYSIVLPAIDQEIGKYLFLSRENNYIDKVLDA